MRIFVRLCIPIILLFSCNHPAERKEAFTILTLKGPSAMGMVYLIDSPGFHDGKPVRIEILDEPMQIRGRMLKDQPEMVVLPLNMASILYNKGLPYRVAAIPGWGTLFLAGTDHLVTGWADLKGHKVFVMGRGATPDILFRYLLQVNGLVAGKDVSLDYSFPTHIDLANAAAAGQADLALLPEPSVSMVMKKNPQIRIIMDLNREWSVGFPEYPDIPQTALMIRQDFIANHPLWVENILNNWEKSIDSVNGNPAMAAQKIKKYDILHDSVVAVKAIPGCNLRFRKASDVKFAINNYLSILYQYRPETVGGKIPDEGFISK